MSDFLNFDKSKEHIKKSSVHLAGGVNSTFRTGMKPNALSFVSGEGAYLIDIDGNKLIDYYLGMGPMILGYNPPAIKKPYKKVLKTEFFLGLKANMN